MQATCLLAAPPALWQRVTLAGQAAGRRAHAGAAPCATPETPGAGGDLGGGGDIPGVDQADAGGRVVVHARFSFDRTPLRRMHAALAHAARTSDGAFRLLPVWPRLLERFHKAIVQVSLRGLGLPHRMLATEDACMHAGGA